MAVNRNDRLARSTDRQHILDYLSAHRMFGVLPAAVLGGLVPEVTERAFPKGYHLHHAGDPTSHVFVLTSGLIAMISLDELGKERVVVTYSSSNVVGVATTVLGFKHAYTARALLPTRALLIPGERFRHLYHRFPEFAYQVLHELYWTLRRSQDAITCFTQTSAAARIAAYLLDSAAPSASHARESVTVELGLSHRDLALLLGTTRETVTRALVHLSRIGLITVSGRRVTILRVDGLRHVAER